MQEAVYKRGFRRLHNPSLAYYQSARTRESRFRTWLRLSCHQGTGLPRGEELELPDFTGHHWSGLAFRHLAGLGSECFAVKRVSLSSHMKNVHEREVEWKWRLGKALGLLSRLEVLRLHDCVDDDVLVKVAKHCPSSMRRLVLSGYAPDLTDEGMEEFAEIMREERKETSLEMIDLRKLHYLEEISICSKFWHDTFTEKMAKANKVPLT